MKIIIIRIHILINNVFNMSISFKESIDINKINEILIEYDNINVLLWYVGPYGLSFDCVKYYKKFSIN